ncbi:peptide transporter [Anaerocolumna sedimenticola]|uniref:Peptide transporter n=1 Tax=Anaerocolumna sedimenticola TaxID=2696063 RepID=A0A6P1TQ32_9FIRM|nr:peptide transporter [Anaerocolumna sedimenticola]QHQ62001.1 peptide transporter [Anaerocolumna sedimenticola]
MKNLVELKDLTREEILQVFELADRIKQGEYSHFLSGKTVVLFFPSSSVRTRVTYEKGINLLGGHTILFDSDVLEKKEKIEDVIGYLNNWADAIVVRHGDIELVKDMAKCAKVPVINAMTKINHPCEILTDLYALSKIRKDYLEGEYLYVGASGNIGRTWIDASDLLGFSITQCCPSGYEMESTNIAYDIADAIMDKDIVLTDSLSKEQLQDFNDYQITCELMDKANDNALLNPCPPFFRGEEVADDVISSKYFVGYDFKKSLLEVQQAIIVFTMTN